MTRRIRNLFIAVTLSLAMWAGIIQGGMAVYRGAFPSTDATITASID